MSRYKKGEKVLTPLGVGVVYAEEEFIFDLDEWHIRVVVGEKFGFNRVITFEVCDLKPYKSAHDKLLELGWKQISNDIGIIIYEKSGSKIIFAICIKFWFVTTYENRVYLELSKILTQYLEELELENDK